MKDDYGFAPNPFKNFLTLANCKPLIRKCKKPGDWIAGFTSKSLNGDPIGEERLIYLMKVSKKITYAEYWNDPQYECKKPISNPVEYEDKQADNIYKPVNGTDFVQIANKNHFENEIVRDLSGKFVLLSDCFYYFGGKPISIPKEIRPGVPKSQSAHGKRTYEIEKINQFISYIENNNQKGLINMPHQNYAKQNKSSE
jgi:hypothetical protein